MKLLDTFAGIGGFSLGLESSGMETIAFCEIEDYPRKVLAKNWPGIPIAKDVTKLNYKDEVLYDDGQEIYRGPIDVISGGFPCQDISVAGNQAGIEEGTRSGLWSECARLLREIQPKYAIYENVTALLSGDSGGWFQRVLSDISEVGYDAEWHCIPASELGAHHHRDRVWIIAYDNGSELRNKQELKPRVKNKAITTNNGKQKNVANSQGQGSGRRGNGNKKEGGPGSGNAQSNSSSSNVPNAGGSGSSRQRKYEQSFYPKEAKIGEAIKFINGGTPDIWKIEPDVDRVVDGIPNRSHRLKGLGNAVVPQIPELIGRAIMESHND
jgi:DNA (cytosine-5)-methyltransferase 1